MKLVRCTPNPFGALDELQDEINKLFNLSQGKTLPAETGAIPPLVDISEDSDNIYVEAELPGLEQKDINVSLRKDYLVITGKRENSKEEKKKNYHRVERSYQSFFRQIPLHRSVDSRNAKASYKNGVLNLTLPKKEEEKEKDIKINVE